LKKKIAICVRRRIYMLPPEQIIYMEKDMRKIRVYMGMRTVEFYGQFKDIIPELDRRFMCCHRSYLINMDKIVSMVSGRILLENDYSIILGRDTYCRAVKMFNEYIKEM